MLDTDICSYVMKRSSPTLLIRIEVVAPTDLCMSVTTKAELLYGVRMSPDMARDDRALRGFLTYVAVVGISEEAAEHYADIRADLTRQGTLIGANDLLIAAHARSLELTLITNKMREFSRVQGLSLENWMA